VFDPFVYVRQQEHVVSLVPNLLLYENHCPQLRVSFTPRTILEIVTHLEQWRVEADVRLSSENLFANRNMTRVLLLS